MPQMILPLFPEGATTINELLSFGKQYESCKHFDCGQPNARNYIHRLEVFLFPNAPMQLKNRQKNHLKTHEVDFFSLRSRKA